MAENGSRPRVIIDCDPGVDDAIALMVAAAPTAGFELAGVTAVAGNLPLDDTFRNARSLMAFLGKHDVPVHAGAARPLQRDPVPAIHHIHGWNGLGGLELAVPASSARRGSAIDHILEVCAEGPVTLCPIGPLTTVARLLEEAPEVASSIERVVLMGGAAFVPGNVTDTAEFNIWADPHAAAVVFDAQIEKVMIGLDVTMQVGADPTWIDALDEAKHRWGTAAAHMLRGYNSGSMALHDPCVPVYLDRPDYFNGRRCSVSIDTEESTRFGQSVANPDPQGNTLVLTEVDPDAVRAHVAAAILSASG
ncbi:nucleoside hydrolase [Hwanghaeella sp.]|uniref:nucleoside hydrolase n=1 Tax=Hwanghaeella sp. TaxID=2605943 RepID=UPI003CCBB7BC